MSLGTNGAAAAQLEDPTHENEFEAAQAELQASAEAAAEATAVPSDGQLMAAAASDSPASA